MKSTPLLVIFAFGLFAANAFKLEKDFPAEGLSIDEAHQAIKVLKELAELVAEAVDADEDVAESFSKRFFWTEVEDTIKKVTDAFSKIYDESKEQVESEASKLGVSIDFDAVLDKLKKMIVASTTSAACKEICEKASTLLFGPGGSVVASAACSPLCSAAIAALKNVG